MNNKTKNWKTHLPNRIVLIKKCKSNEVNEKWLWFNIVTVTASRNKW